MSLVKVLASSFEWYVNRQHPESLKISLASLICPYFRQSRELYLNTISILGLTCLNSVKQIPLIQILKSPSFHYSFYVILCHIHYTVLCHLQFLFILVYMWLMYIIYVFHISAILHAESSFLRINYCHCNCHRVLCSIRMNCHSTNKLNISVSCMLHYIIVYTFTQLQIKFGLMSRENVNWIY